MQGFEHGLPLLSLSLSKCQLIKETTPGSQLFSEWLDIQVQQTQDTAAGNEAN